MPAAPVSRNRIPIRTRASQFGVRHPECTLLYQTIAEHSAVDPACSP